MRVAIPCWQGRVSPVFDSSGALLLVDINNGRESRRWQGSLIRSGPFERAGEFLRYGADTLICGAISEPLESALRHAGVDVIGFVCGPAEEVLSAFLAGDLSDPGFRMPGARGCRHWLVAGDRHRHGPFAQIHHLGKRGPGGGAGHTNS